MSLTKKLVIGLKAIADDYSSTQDIKERQRLLLNVYNKISEENYDKNITENFQEIINYYVVEESLEIGSLIDFLQGNAELDNQTIITEERDSFDRKFGTTTSLIIPQYELPEKVSLQRFKTSGRYHPSPISSVIDALKGLEKYINYNEYIFIDVGSGLGRNLLLASSFPFIKLVGLEHSKYLHDIAKENIEIYKSDTIKCDNFDLQCINALDYPLPEENLVLYFWKPFSSNEAAMEFVNKMEEFVAKKKYRIFLIFLEYVYPAVLHNSDYFTYVDHFPTSDIFSEKHGKFSITFFSGTNIK
jgi:hypothetical protein